MSHKVLLKNCAFVDQNFAKNQSLSKKWNLPPKSFFNLMSSCDFGPLWLASAPEHDWVSSGFLNRIEILEVSLIHRLDFKSFAFSFHLWFETISVRYLHHFSAGLCMGRNEVSWAWGVGFFFGWIYFSHVSFIVVWYFSRGRWFVSVWRQSFINLAVMR